jgi:hypothetical protein
MAEELTTTLRQVSDQCRVVAYLATELANVNHDYAVLFAAADPRMAGIADQVGKRTAELMEYLGDVLNGMDAVSEDSDWLEPIFKQAHLMFPEAK